MLFAEISLVTCWEMKEHMAVAPTSEAGAQALFSRHANILRAISTMSSLWLLAVWLAGLTFANPLVGARVDPGSSSSREKRAGPRLWNVWVDRANIPLEDQGRKPRASSQPAISFPWETVPGLNFGSNECLSLDFLGPDGWRCPESTEANSYHV